MTRHRSTTNFLVNLIAGLIAYTWQPKNRLSISLKKIWLYCQPPFNSELRLIYNVPDSLFKPKLAPTYTGILDWLGTARRKDFKCQNGQVELFGPGREQWSQKKAQAFIKALQDMWDTWD